MKITKEIIKKRTSFSIERDRIVFATIASLFSILFSLIIVIELAEFVNGVTLSVLAIFTTSFIITNETIKVRNVRAYYNGDKKAIIGAIFTFLISFSLSGIGVYLYTNDTKEITHKINEKLIQEKNAIENSYTIQINEINDKEYENTKEYKSFSETLTFWKNKSSATLDERNEIREHIRKTEDKISNGKSLFIDNKDNKIDRLITLKEGAIALINTQSNSKKSTLETNNLLSIIFFVMVFLSELGIIVLNKNLAQHYNKIDKFVESKQAEYYIICRKLLDSLYLSNKKGIVNIKDALYSPVMNKLEWTDDKKWSEVKKFYNVLISIGILNSTSINTGGKKELVTKRILKDQKEALDKLDSYFEKLLML
jgi:hypothetical protein